MPDVERVQIVVDADDNASDKLRNVQSSLKTMQNGINNFNYSLRQYNSFMGGFNRTIINSFKEMGSEIYDFTTDAIKNFTEFSEQHARTLGAMSSNYDSSIEAQTKFIQDSQKLKEQALTIGMYGVNGQGSLSTTPEVSALQTQLVKSGVSPDAIANSNVTKQTLQFAQANDLNNEMAVEFGTKLSNQFGVEMGTQEYSDMLDKVSHAADTSVIDVVDIIESMKYASGITSGLSRSIDETLGMVSVLGNFGLTGSQAGTGIQSFLSRLLTGDTTVITKAQAGVAPPKALEAFYDFSKYAKSDGSGITYDDILNEKFTETDITGSLRPMDEVTNALDETMGSLNDEEQAWFAKKLFGLYQMKSAYALINGDVNEDGRSELQTVIDDIQNNSQGTNEKKLSELLNSQYGQLESLANLYSGIKTDIGDRLSPLVNAIRDELFEFLSKDGNYDINFDNLRTALDESCDLIEEKYGKAIADAVRNIGELSIDLTQIGITIAPDIADGIAKVIKSALEGDIFGEDGIIINWEDMIDKLHLSVDTLPKDFQDLGDSVVDVIDFFGKLAAINVATTILQGISSIASIAMNVLRVVSMVVRGVTNAITHATTATTNTTNATIATTNATFGAITTQLMNVTASVVNINGGGGTGSPNSPSSPSMPTGPLLPSAPTGPLLPSAPTGPLLPSAPTGPLLTGPTGTGTTVGTGTGVTIGTLLAAGKAKIVSALINAGLVEATEVISANGATIFANTSLTTGGSALLSGIPILGLGIASIASEWKKSSRRDNKFRGLTDRDDNETWNTDNIKWNNSPIGRLSNLVGYQKDETIKYDSSYVKPNEYQYKNGESMSFAEAPPKKKWHDVLNPFSTYDRKYRRWKENYDKIKNEKIAEEDTFNKVRDLYSRSTNKPLKWDDYDKNKNKFNEWYKDNTYNVSNPGQPRNLVGRNIVQDKENNNNIPLYISKLANDKPMNEKMVNDITLNDNLTITPSFTIMPPNVNVNVKVGDNGAVSKNTTILNNGFASNFNNFYRRITSQNGNGQK